MKVQKPTDDERFEIYKKAREKYEESSQPYTFAGWAPSYEDFLVDEAYQAGRMSVTVKDI